MPMTISYQKDREVKGRYLFRAECAGTVYTGHVTRQEPVRVFRATRVYWLASTNPNAQGSVKKLTRENAVKAAVHFARDRARREKQAAAVEAGKAHAAIVNSSVVLARDVQPDQLVELGGRGRRVFRVTVGHVGTTIETADGEEFYRDSDALLVLVDPPASHPVDALALARDLAAALEGLSKAAERWMPDHIQTDPDGEWAAADDLATAALSRARKAGVLR